MIDIKQLGLKVIYHDDEKVVEIIPYPKIDKLMIRMAWVEMRIKKRW